MGAARAQPVGTVPRDCPLGGGGRGGGGGAGDSTGGGPIVWGLELERRRRRRYWCEPDAVCGRLGLVLKSAYIRHYLLEVRRGHAAVALWRESGVGTRGRGWSNSGGPRA